MTRKDYVLLAAALLKSKPHIDPSIDDNGVRLSAELQFAASATSIATALSQGNPQFDRVRFLKAAGVYA